LLQKLKGYDYTLIITPILLAAFGIVMIYSASMVSTVAENLESTYYFKRQILWFCFGLIGFIFCCILPYKYYQNLVKLMLLISTILLFAVLFFGDVTYNAVRSIDILGFNVQPSEFVKLVLIIYLSYIYSKKQTYIDNFTKGVLPPLLLIIGMVVLIVKQPDIGTATIILLIAGTMIISSGIRFRHLFLLICIAVIALIVVIPYLSSDTRMKRITGAYQPFLDPSDSGHHLIQSYIAISGGGIGGEGLGQSVQKLGYLWGAHTDFIMAIIAEELGVFGIIIVIGLLTTIILRGLFISLKCKDSFGSLLAIGISSMIGFQAFINLGAISGILPITGVTLPFVSYGGSSLLVLMASMGILNNIARTVALEEEQPKVVETNPINKFSNRSGHTWSN